VLAASKQLAAQRTLDEQGYAKLESGEGSYRDILKDKGESARLEQEARGHKDESTIASLLDRKVDELAADPSNLQLAREVADLYAQAGDFDKALKYYKMLAEIPGTVDPTLDRAIHSLTLKQIDRRLEQFDTAAPDHAEQVRQLQHEKDTWMFEDCKRRAEKYPTDLGIKYELGNYYFKLGQFRRPSATPTAASRPRSASASASPPAA
jgi:tetratricopeptide (TPR) repeat protein